jgi:Short C-terminal domain
VTENLGTTTTVNNDIRRRVWIAHVPAEGIYHVVTDGQVSAFINPTLAFGHGSSLGYLPWVFVALFALGLLDMVIALVWSSRLKRRAALAVGLQPSPLEFGTPSVSERHVQSYVPTDDGVRIEQLKTLAALRDSGALTQVEFESEKRRLLDDH